MSRRERGNLPEFNIGRFLCSEFETDAVCADGSKLKSVENVQFKPSTI